MKIKQIYVPYDLWEDYQAGMWRKVNKEEEVVYLKEAIKFTSNHIVYGNAMKEVIKSWPQTMLHNLTSPSTNKRAFLGHCACCHAFKCPEHITRIAWKELTDKQRYLADKVAQETVDKYLIKLDEERNKSIRKNLGTQVLLSWYT